MNWSRAGLVGLLVCALLGLIQMPGGAAPPGPRDDLIAERARGARAIELLGDQLPEAARRNGMSPDELSELLGRDRTAWVDQDGQVLYVDVAPTSGDPQTAQAAPHPYDQTFELHSKPGSQRTIYLDFDGHLVANTAWNSSDGVSNTIPQPPFDLDGNPATFDEVERDVVQEVWQRVAEDYAPFDVDVTTKDPGLDGLRRSSTADSTYGMRVLITPSNTDTYSKVCGGCGGTAYLGVFDNVDSGSGDYDPAWVFTDVPGGTDPKFIGDTVSHEVGHTLALSHDFDGEFDSGFAYYDGHGAWGPIMGTGFQRPIMQWSKGEFAAAGNDEDDLTVITSNGLTYRGDDHANTTTGATDLGAGTTTTRTGIIGRPADKDYFTINRPCSGSLQVDAQPAPTSPNLDLQVRLLDSAGGELGSVDPTSVKVDKYVATGMDAQLDLTVPAGIFHIEVDGVGALDPLTTGYSDYGSLGAYTLSVTGCGVPKAPTSVQTTKDLTAGSVSMTWQQPAYDGGHPIDAYVITKNGATVATLGADARSHTFTGLAPDSSHTLGVAARNSEGVGERAERAIVMVKVPPDPPRIAELDVNPEWGEVDLTWEPPLDSGDSPITHYFVDRTGDYDWGEPFEPERVEADGYLGWTFYDIPLDAEYTFSVIAVSQAGSSAPATRTIYYELPRPPTAPQGVTAVAGDRSATVSWSAPADPGTSPIDAYEISVRNAAGNEVDSDWVEASASTVYPLSQEFTGLTNGTSYRFRVRAVSEDGQESGWVESALVTPTKIVTVPGAPGIGTASSGASGGAITAKARWSSPSSTGGSAITGYYVRAHRMSTTGAILSTKVSGLRSPSSRAYNMPLPRKGKYRFTVIAVNAKGQSAPSGMSNQVTGR